VADRAGSARCRPTPWLRLPWRGHPSWRKV